MAPDLNQVVSIQTRTEASDGHDGIAETWSTTRSRIRASIKPIANPFKDRDRVLAGAIDPRILHEVTLRYWRTFAGDLAGGRARVLYHPTSAASADRTFEIVGPPADLEERHEWVLLQCREAA